MRFGLVARMGLVFTLIVALNLVSLGVFFWAKRSYDQTSLKRQEYVDDLSDLQDIKYQFTRWKVNILSGMFNLSPFVFSTKKLEADIRDLTPHDEKERVFVRQLQQKYLQMKKVSDKVLGILARADQWEDEDELRDTLLDLYNGEVSPLTKGIYRFLDREIESIQKLLDVFEVEAERKLRLVHIVQLVFTLLTLLTLVVFALYLHRKLRQGFATLDEALDSMARGDFTYQARVRGGDEIAVMLTKLNRVIQDLRPVIEKLREVSARLETDAREMKSSAEAGISINEHTKARAEDMKRGAEEILSHTEAEARSINEISSAIQEISQNTTKANTITSEAVEKARLAQGIIHKVGEVSREIESVIQLITGVAEQTKFLALNATIEAARAGEAGKGFAVVANEVKELARQTAEATGEITEKVRSMQAEASQAVQATDEIVKVIEEINQIASAIAAAIEEQTAVIAQIAEQVEATRGSAQTLSEEAREAFEAAIQALDSARRNLEQAQTLSRLSQELASLAAQFRV